MDIYNYVALSCLCLMIVSAVIGVSVCMLSGRISRWEERNGRPLE